MTWLQLRLDTDPTRVERLEQLMLATGAVAVTMEDNADQPVLEPGVGETPLWGHTRLTGHPVRQYLGIGRMGLHA